MVLALIGLTISHVGCGRVLSYCAHATAHMQLNETAKWKKKIVERLSRTQTVAGPRVPGKEVDHAWIHPTFDPAVARIKT